MTREVLLISEPDEGVFEEKLNDLYKEYNNVNIEHFSTATYKDENQDDCVMYSAIVRVE